MKTSKTSIKEEESLKTQGLVEIIGRETGAPDPERFCNLSDITEQDMSHAFRVRPAQPRVVPITPRGFLEATHHRTVMHGSQSQRAKNGFKSRFSHLLGCRWQ